jgi:hypothetical protein
VNDSLHVKITVSSRQAHDEAVDADGMTRLPLVLTVLASGCVILPATKTTRRAAGTEQSALTYGRVKEITLQTGSSLTDVRVRATSKRECQRQIFAVTEIKKTKHASLGVDDPRGRALGVIFAPVTIPISAIITGLIVASSDDDIRRVSKPLRTETIDCTTHAAGLVVELQFPSGHVYRGKTDDNGVLVSPIPRDEPYSGSVIVRGGESTAQVQYEQQVPPIAATRDAVESCRAEHSIAGVTMKLTIDDRGLASRLWLSAGNVEFRACVSRKLVGLVFPSALRNTTVALPFEAPTT